MENDNSDTVSDIQLNKTYKKLSVYIDRMDYIQIYEEQYNDTTKALYKSLTQLSQLKSSQYFSLFKEISQYIATHSITEKEEEMATPTSTESSKSLSVFLSKPKANPQPPKQKHTIKMNFKTHQLVTSTPSEEKPKETSQAIEEPQKPVNTTKEQEKKPVVQSKRFDSSSFKTISSTLSNKNQKEDPHNIAALLRKSVKEEAKQKTEVVLTGYDLEEKKRSMNESEPAPVPAKKPQTENPSSSSYLPAAQLNPSLHVSVNQEALKDVVDHMSEDQPMFIRQILEQFGMKK